MIIEENLGRTVYVVKTYSHIESSSKTFDNLVGTIMLNDEDEDAKYYEYMIEFPQINNAFLCEGSHEFEGYTIDERPELFL